MSYTVRRIGHPNTLGMFAVLIEFSCYVFVWRFRVANGVSENRIFIEKDGVPISPFHDVPLYAKYVQLYLSFAKDIKSNNMIVSRRLS